MKSSLQTKSFKVLLNLLKMIITIQLVAYSLSEVAQAQNRTPVFRSESKSVKETNPQLKRPKVIAPTTSQTTAQAEPTQPPQPHPKVSRLNPKYSDQAAVLPKYQHVFARSTYYYAGEAKSDADTQAKKTSSLVRIDTIQNLGLGVVAVDPDIIPYGSQIIAPDGEVYIAADRGGDVVSRKAARELAMIKGLDENSAESRALVLDFYSKNQVGGYWDMFIVIPYTNETDFRELRYAEKIAYLEQVAKSRHHIALAVRD